MVSDIKRVASELGKTPTRREYLDHGGSFEFESLFGSWTLALQAAGLDPINKKAQRNERTDLIKRALTVPLDDLTLRRDPKVIQVLSKEKRVLSIGDIHAPWGCAETASLILAVAEKLNPTHIVQVGDARDMFAVGNRHPHTRLSYNPREELDRGTEFLSWLWKSLRDAVPNAECFQLLGNHDIRPLKRILESSPDLEVLLDLTRFYRFDGVKLIEDSREVLKIENTAYIHGYRSKNGDHITDLQCNVVHGHSHRPGIVYRKLSHQAMHWEMDIGTCAMGDSIAMSYTPMKIGNMIQGFGFEDEWGPRFIHKP